jgi:YgiT-type zinc finger domain-containing protein
MKCRICGGEQRRTETDLPFKTGEHSIVIIKQLPVFQCERCTEFSLDDPTMMRVDELLSRVAATTELEVVSFAA